ncbi:unnamed protein product [Cunninghamella blakesleeana]
MNKILQRLGLTDEEVINDELTGNAYKSLLISADHTIVMLKTKYKVEWNVFWKDLPKRFIQCWCHLFRTSLSTNIYILIVLPSNGLLK